MKKSTIIIVVVLLALVLGAVAFMMRDDKQSTTSQSSTSDGEPDAPLTATIMYTDEGFGPASVTVAVGATVSIENSSSGDMQVSSDEHPVHSDNAELNQARVASGETVTFVVSNVGSWGYHDHLNPSKKGTITVEAD